MTYRVETLIIKPNIMITYCRTAFPLSQRPTYVEVGPLMTTRSGEVRCGTAKGQELMI